MWQRDWNRSRRGKKPKEIRVFRIKIVFYLKLYNSALTKCVDICNILTIKIKKRGTLKKCYLEQN